MSLRRALSALTVAVMAIAMLAVAAPPASAGPYLLPRLQGPTNVTQATGAEIYRGRVISPAGNMPIAARPVTILVNGRAQQTLFTNGGGMFGLPARFTRVGGNTLQAVVNRGTSLESRSPVLRVNVTRLPSRRTVTAGVVSSCAVGSDGHAYCWGANLRGELGTGEPCTFPGGDQCTLPATTARQVVDIEDVVAIAAGIAHACAVLGDGTVWCWGFGSLGQMGNGTTAEHNLSPVQVSGIDDAIDISTSLATSCALLASGQIKCWGLGAGGNLGNGTAPTFVSTPVTVSGIDDAVAVSAGWLHTCAVLGDGTARCWGSDLAGNLGRGILGGTSLTPTAVIGLSDVESIGANLLQTCAIDAGEVKCFGLVISNFIAITATPVSLGVFDAVDVATGLFHSCALRDDGTVPCWGLDLFTGDPSPAFALDPPTDVAGIDDAVSIGAGHLLFLAHTCVGREFGVVSCWGIEMFGELGNGGAQSEFLPAPVDVIGLP